MKLHSRSSSNPGQHYGSGHAHDLCFPTEYNSKKIISPILTTRVGGIFILICISLYGNYLLVHFDEILKNQIN